MLPQQHPHHFAALQRCCRIPLHASAIHALNAASSSLTTAIPGNSLAFWPQRANAASLRPRCLVGIKRRSSSQCLVRLRPLSTLFHSSFQRPPQSHYCLAGSNDAWRQHPWLKAKHNIRYMCVHAAPRTVRCSFSVGFTPQPRFPGLGTAVAIFSVYLVGEHFYKKLNNSSNSHH